MPQTSEEIHTDIEYKDNIFINHIDNHLKNPALIKDKKLGERVGCKICHKNDEIYKDEHKKFIDQLKSQQQEYEKREQILLQHQGKLTQEQIKGYLDAQKKQIIEEIKKEFDNCIFNNAYDIVKIEKFRQKLSQIEDGK